MTDLVGFAEFERRGWDEVAEKYDRATSGVSRATYVGPLLVALGATAGGQVVDVATGPGFVVAGGLARGLRMIGVDVSANMLDIARRSNPDAEFRLGAAEALPLDDASVDGVVSAWGMPHFADHAAFFAEAHRVLRPSGRLVFSSWCPPPRNAHIGLFAGTLARLGKLDVGLPVGPDMFRFANPEVCQQELSAAGFVEVKVEDLPVEWTTDGGADALITMIGEGAVRSRALWDAQTSEVQSAIRDALGEGLLAYRNSDGIYRVPAAAVLVSAVRS